MQEELERKIYNLIDNSDLDKAFELIVKTYKERLYWHIRKMLMDHEDTNDVLQATFIKAWKGINNFRRDSKLFTWLYRISTNETITFLNSKNRKTTTNIEDVYDSAIKNLEEDHYFTGDEIQKKLFAAIATLPEKQKVIFNLKYFEDLKYEEISEILNTSVGALKASYHHAVKKIESFFNDN